MNYSRDYQENSFDQNQHSNVQGIKMLNKEIPSFEEILMNPHLIKKCMNENEQFKMNYEKTSSDTVVSKVCNILSQSRDLEIRRQKEPSNGPESFLKNSRRCLRRNKNKLINHFDSSKIELKNLYKFLTGYFGSQNLDEYWMNNLSNRERKILIALVWNRDYSNKQEIIALIRGKQRNDTCLRKMVKIRRKEENLKYGFRIIILEMFNQFKVIQIERLVRIHKEKFNMAKLDFHLLFYLFHFGKKIYGISFDASVEKLLSKTVTELQMWKGLRDVVFPEMGIKWGDCLFKSLSKSFLQNLSKYEEFAMGINEKLFNVILYFRNNCGPENLNPESKEAKYVKSIDQVITKTNLKEIGKLFVEWDNIIKNKGIEKESAFVKEITRNVSKNNFKLPWTVEEVRNAFLESFIALNEVLIANKLTSNSSGIYHLL